MIDKIVGFFTRTTTEGILSMDAATLEKHRNINKGASMIVGVHSDILDDIDPAIDNDSPGVFTIAEAGVRVTELLGRRSGK